MPDKVKKNKSHSNREINKQFLTPSNPNIDDYLSEMDRLPAIFWLCLMLLGTLLEKVSQIFVNL